MISRRTFVNAVSAGVVGASVATGATPIPRRRRLAVITTEWWERSHAWHMAERFLHGYPPKVGGTSPLSRAPPGPGERFARSLARETLKNPRL